MHGIAAILICTMFLQPNMLAAQEHVVSTGDLRETLRLASEKRNNDIKTIREFFGTDTAKKSLNNAHFDLQKINSAVSALDDSELSRLAGRVQAAQKEMVGGALSNQELTYIVIALAAAVIVLVLK
jgi:hypothetical protein